MDSTNRVIGGYSAVIDGRFTGLAGCANSDRCGLGSRCLRADKQLQMRENFRVHPECGLFIPNADEIGDGR